MISDTNKSNIYKNIIYILLFILAAYFCQIAGSIMPVNTNISMFITYMLYVIIFGAFAVKAGILVSDAGFLTELRISRFVYLVLSGISLQYLVAAILTCITMWAPKLMSSYNDMINTSFSKDNGIWTILTTSLIAPLGEELLFRGLILYHTRQMTGPVMAVIINGILFGLYHMNLVQLCYALPIGILLASIAALSHAVYPSIILHMAINITANMLPEALFTKKETLILTIMVSLIIAIICIWRYFTTYRDK